MLKIFYFFGLCFNFQNIVLCSCLWTFGGFETLPSFHILLLTVLSWISGSPISSVTRFGGASAKQFSSGMTQLVGDSSLHGTVYIIFWFVSSLIWKTEKYNTLKLEIPSFLFSTLSSQNFFYYKTLRFLYWD